MSLLGFKDENHLETRNENLLITLSFAIVCVELQKLLKAFKVSTFKLLETV